MKVSPILAIVVALISLFLSGCSTHGEEQHHEEAHRITATRPQSKAVTLTKRYVCQIHSKRHIKVCALEPGYLEEITVKEGQHVKEHDPLFKVRPILYQTKRDAEQAQADLADMQFKYAEQLRDRKVISDNEVKLRGAELAKANAKANQAQAELDFATVIAPFDGIIDRLYRQQGSLVDQGEVLTTLSDNSVMWVYFNVPEKDYIEYMTSLKEHKDKFKIELELAGQTKFDHLGTISAIEADFNNENGNIPFRADFDNPDSLLRHGQTGTVWISRVHDAILIPQRATFEVLQKRYVYVIDEENVAHQREISYQNELEDIFVLKDGVLNVDDKIVLEGVRQIRDGDKVEYEDRDPDEVASHLKYHAE